MIDNRTVGKTISQLRQSRGMTQQQLAATLNVSHQAVSKWENGAALPDVQTMMDLTKLFGISMEQLLTGNIPEPQPESTVSGLDAHLQNIGSFVTGVFDDIGNIFKAPAETVEDLDEPTETTSADDDSVLSEQHKGTPGFDLQALLNTAPFMTKQAVADMLKSAKQALSPAEIAKFAPFVDADFLEELIRGSKEEINWDTLRRIAPFLKKEVVDACARAIAKGEEFGKQTAPKLNNDVQKAFDDIGNGINQAVQNVIRFGENVGREMSKAFESMGSEQDSHAGRLEQLRKQAFERALEQGEWDWMEAHLNELADEDLKRTIAEAASTAGKEEWVRKYLPEYADSSMIEAAIANGEWAWLGENAWRFSIEVQHQVARAALEAENWPWFASFAETLELDSIILEIATKARKAGAREVAVQLTRYDMNDEQAEQMVMEALDDVDLEFFDMMLEGLSADSICRCCMHMAKSGAWDTALRYGSGLTESGLERLMQEAIEEGNFDMIDRLDAMLSERLPKE